METWAASPLFRALVGAEGHVALMPGLSHRQLDLLLRLHRLVREAQAQWLEAPVAVKPDPEAEEDPPTPAMLERLGVHGTRMRERVVARAEAIALEVVLTPEHAQEALRRAWVAQGVWALLDPELARRLSMSKAQRDRVAALLRARADTIAEFNAETNVRLDAIYEAGLAKRLGEDDRADQYAEAQRDNARQVTKYDDGVWAVLRPEQRRQLDELLAGARRAWDRDTQAPTPATND